MKYRPEIDGLRALAVLPVLLFHAGHTKLFGGGYLGVDVFFVISGYLITGIILGEMESGRFSLLKFYERRVRRILPPLILVMFATALMAGYFMDAEQFIELGTSLRYVIFFASNFFFLNKTGYFDGNSELRPMLHTWSLAVEEQFYLFFPLLLLMLWAPAKKRLLYVSSILFVISLIGSEWASRVYPLENFYLLPSRGWELLAGSILAQVEFGRSGRRGSADFLGKIFPAIGLILIGFSFFFFDAKSRHPGLPTLLPVVGTLLVLWFSGARDWGTRVLSAKIPVGIGLISYSLYLWHQPILAFVRMDNFGELTWKRELAGFLFLFPVAAFSWRFVEGPFRSTSRMPSRFVFYSLSAALLILLALSQVILQFKGFPGRYPFPPSLAASFNRDETGTDATLGKCVDNPFAHEKKDDWYCVAGSKTSHPPDFVLFGDSHAYSIIPAFAHAAKQSGTWGLVTSYSACLPFLGVVMHTNDQKKFNCQAMNDRIFNYVKENKIKKLFLVARWQYYISWAALPGKIGGPTPQTNEERKVVFLDQLAATVAAYRALGTQVYFFSQVPRQPHDPREVYKKIYMKPTSLTELLVRKRSVPLFGHRAEQNLENGALSAVAGGRIRFINLEPDFCDASYCPMGTATESYYHNEDHIGIIGNHRVRERVLGLLREPIVEP